MQVQVQVQALGACEGDAESFAFQVHTYSVFGVYIVHVHVMVYFVCM